MTVTATGYLFGVGRLLAVCVPAFVGARAWRRRLAPDWGAAHGALADAIGAISGVVVLSEILGSLGQFRRGPVIAASVIVGLGSSWWCGRRTARPAPIGLQPPAARAARRPARDVIVASASSALVLSEWSTWVARAISLGIGNGSQSLRQLVDIGRLPADGDSLWYHMPPAAAFVQSGWTTHLQYLNGEALVTYYPVNTALLHAIGILTMGSDVLSVFVNIALLPVGLLAGWCIGERYGLGPASLAGAAVAFTIPAIVVTNAGTAKDDVLGIVGLLACLAFVVRSGTSKPASEAFDGAERASAIYGGLAAGLAIGSKLSLVAPIVAVAASLAILTPSGSRRSTMLRWVGAAASTGGYWFLRNLLRVGNPLPGLSVGIGRFRLPRPATPSMDNFGSNLLHNILNGRVWHRVMLPGLTQGFGSAWPATILIVAAALALGVATLRGRDLVAPAVGAFAFAAVLITPGTVWAPQLIGDPGVRAVSVTLFAFTLRYLLPVESIGLVIVPLVARRWRYGSYIATVALGVALAATQLTPQGRQSWSADHGPVALVVAAITIIVIVGLISGRPRRAQGPPRQARLRRAATVGFAAAVLIAVGRPIEVSYRNHRYAGLELAAWADRQAGARIGFSGFVFAYPLYGARLQNHVQMIGEHGPDGAWHPVRTCQAWRQDVRQAHLQYVVVPVGGPAIGLGVDLSRWRMGLPGGEPPDEPPESRWTRDDPGEPLVFFSSEGAAVYAVTGPATTQGCS